MPIQYTKIFPINKRNKLLTMVIEHMVLISHALTNENAIRQIIFSLTKWP